jgi:hypothetical protein
MTPFYPIFNNDKVGKFMLNSKKKDVAQNLRDIVPRGRIDWGLACWQ